VKSGYHLKIYSPHISLISQKGKLHSAESAKSAGLFTMPWA